jgi:hypothetical protein
MNEVNGIKEELEKKRQESVDKTDSNAQSVKLLMSGEDGDKEILRRTGLDHDINKAEKLRGLEIDRKSIEDTYKGFVFTEKEIKEICIKYDLRFLPTRYFRGALDTEVADKLKKFVAEHPEIGAVSESFYIIAPSNTFDLDGSDANPSNKTDLILVYKVRTEYKDVEKFVFIHKWGKEEFSPIRRLKGIFYESESSMTTVLMSSWIVILSTIFGMSFSGFTGEWYQYLNFIWIVPVSFGLSMLTLLIMFNDSDMRLRLRTSNKIWNTRDTRRE